MVFLLPTSSLQWSALLPNAVASKSWPGTVAVPRLLGLWRAPFSWNTSAWLRFPHDKYMSSKRERQHAHYWLSNNQERFSTSLRKWPHLLTTCSIQHFPQVKIAFGAQHLLQHHQRYTKKSNPPRTNIVFPCLPRASTSSPKTVHVTRFSQCPLSPHLSLFWIASSFIPLHSSKLT